MQKIFFLFTIILSLFILNTPIVKSQITIGSLNSPVDGALLELKQEDGLVNSTKGLLLPRVNLTRLTIKDDGTENMNLTIAGADTNEPWDENSHVGLTVYNVNYIHQCIYEWLEYSTLIKLMPGLYTWGGKKWNAIYAEEIREEGDVRKVTYHTDASSRTYFTMKYEDEEESYYYSTFGAAGTWMTQNLRTKYTPSGKKMENKLLQQFPVLEDETGNYRKFFAYPNTNKKPSEEADYDDSNGLKHAQNPSIFNKYKHYGLLYDWYTTVDHKNCTFLNTGQGGSHVSQSQKLQRICPDGWYLPTDADWNLLEKELSDNPGKYSYITDPSYKWPTDVNDKKQWEEQIPNPWNGSSWDYDDALYWRGKHGAVMRSGDQVASSTRIPSGWSNSYNGTTQYSVLYPAGVQVKTPGNFTPGFDAYLVGYAEFSKKGAAVEYGTAYWGELTYFWSGDSANNYHAWSRALGNFRDQVYRRNTSKNAYQSVRCKKED